MRCRFLAAVAALTIAFAVEAQQPTENGITGTLAIDYQTRVKTDDAGLPQSGVTDTYTLDLSVGTGTLMRGKIYATPTLFSKILGRQTQQGQLKYDVNLLVRNPNNFQQTLSVGKLAGIAPIDSAGVYRYDQGTLRVAIETTGKIEGFQSPFKGSASGKPPVNSSAWSAAAAKASSAITITKTAQGRTISLKVTDYDIMSMQGLVIGGGPTRSYPSATVNGEMVYDNDRGSWYFRNAGISYSLDGKEITDKLGGSIRWVEDPERATNGKGEYQFDVRLNAPDQQGAEAAAFAAADSESDFFSAPDASLQSLTGTAKYRDSMAGETVTNSQVAIDLLGHNLTQQQRLVLAKLIWLVSVIPMNAE